MKRVGSWQSVSSARPDLMDEWHPTKNGDVRPEDLSSRSNDASWWKCRNCGHEWSCKTFRRTDGGGCRICMRLVGAKTKATPKPGQSLAEKFPTIAAEWHPTKNGDVTPAQVNAGAKRRASWMCAAGHEWEASVSTRTMRMLMCDACRLIRNGTTYLSEHQDLIAEMHPTKNSHLPPLDTIIATGATRVAWRCITCGHEWECRLVERTTNGTGCPPCKMRAGGRKHSVPKPGNSFAEVEPELAKLWDYARNATTPSDHSARAKFEAHFICGSGHQTPAIPLYHAKGGNLPCRKCTRAGVSLWELEVHRALLLLGFPFDEFPAKVSTGDGRRAIAVDLTISAMKIGVELDGWFWHKARIANDRTSNERLSSVGWNVVRVRCGLPRISKRDVVVSQLPTVPETVLAIAGALDRLGVHGTSQVTAEGVTALDYAVDASMPRRRQVAYPDSLEAKFPNVASEWDAVENGLPASQVSAHASIHGAWVCRSCGCRFRAKVGNRTNRGHDRLTCKHPTPAL